MPLEFLLATHIATMAPDLSYKLATSFDTEVKILLSEVDANVDAAVVPEGASDSDRVKFTEINENVNNSVVEKFKNFGYLDSEDILNIFKNTNLKSYTGDDENYKCTGPSSWEKISFNDNGSSLFKFVTLSKAEYTLDDVKKQLNTMKIENENTIKDKLDEFKRDKLNPQLDQDGNNITKIDTNYANFFSQNFNDTITEILSDDKYNESKWEKTADAEIKKCRCEKKGDDVCYFLELIYTVEENEDSIVIGVEMDFEYTGDTFVLEKVCCSDEKVTHSDNIDNIKVCQGCINYVNNIYDGLNKIAVPNAKTYIPYIYSVTDHWFRNVYFTADAIKDYTKYEDTAIQVDDDYEQKTGERWTLYDTYKENGEKKYELYVYWKKDEYDYEENFKKENDKYLVCREVKSGGNYKLADEGGTTYVKSSSGKYKLCWKGSDGKCSDYTDELPEEFKVGKKALSDSDITDGWSAYGSEINVTSDNTWKNMNTDDEDTPGKVKELSKLGVKFQYHMDSGSISQVEDAVRGVTNPTIKKLFLDDYYLYDGSKAKADAIDEAKKLVQNKIKDGTLTGDDADVDDPDAFKKLQKMFKGSYQKIPYTDENGKLKSTTIDQISGPISLTKTSLSAFSLLENMHTLDAEYIYHDFKELVVELNYFDKEDLSEAEDEVMMFPVSGISSAGWPVVRYDKSEEFYGTLIHSATDLEAKRAETEVEMAKMGEGDNSEGLTEEEKADNENKQRKYIESKTSNSTDTNSNSLNESQFKQNTFLDTATKCWQYVCDHGSSISYGGVGRAYPFANSPTSNPNSSSIDCTGYVCWVLYEYSDEWKKDNPCQITSEDLVSKNFTKYGWEEISVSRGQDVSNILQPGDILIRYDGNTHHANICKEITENGDIIAYDCGGKDHWTGAGNRDNGYRANWFAGTDAPGKIVRMGGATSFSSEETEFAGYAGSTEEAPEYVLAPVTGEVIKYGTVERESIELIAAGHNKDEATQEVGFIKIRILGSKEGVSGKKCEFFETETKVTDKNKKDDDTVDSWLENNYKDVEKKLEKLGYNYFWEEYQYAGINDHVLYIEGFDVSDILKRVDIDASKNGGNIEKLVNYITNEDNKDKNNYSTAYRVPNLLDDTKEFELKIQEKAKEKAVYAFSEKVKNDDGKEETRYYIKEGAVIGKTYSSDNENITKETEIEVLDTEAQADDSDEVATKKESYKIGNYMRMILRDTDDEVVENIEDFVETENSNGSGTEAGIYGTQLLEGNSIDIPQQVLDAQEGYQISYEAINRAELGMTQWSQNTVQRAVYDEWVSQGSIAYDGTEKSGSLSKGLAIITINGKDYVPVAVKTTFGNPGDYIQVVFEDGTMLDCLIADAKGTDSGSYIYNGVDYGHTEGSKCNILEVLIKGEKSGSSYTAGLNKDKLSWWGKKVVKITNGGHIFPN